MVIIGNSLEIFSTIRGERKFFRRSLFLMKNENELNPQDKRNIFIGQGNYNENIEGDYNINIGVSPELYAEAIKQGEEAKRKLKELERDRSLSATAKRILAEAEEAEENGDNKLYLEKIQEYSRILNDEPIKRAAEAKILEKLFQ